MKPNPSPLSTLVGLSVWTLVTASSNVYAQSQSKPTFDCAKAQSRVEKFICASVDLGRLDVQLLQTYREAVAIEPDPNALKATQLSWLKQRNACMDAACVASSYQSRLAELQALTASDPSPNNTPPNQPQLAIRPSDSISQENLNAIPVPRSGSGSIVQGGEIAGTRQFDAQIRAAQREQGLQDERQAAAIRQMRAQQEAELAEQRRAEAAYRAEMAAKRDLERKREIEERLAAEESTRIARAEYERFRAQQEAQQREAERLEEEALRKKEEAVRAAELERQKAQEAAARIAEQEKQKIEEAGRIRQAQEREAERKAQEAEYVRLKAQLRDDEEYCSKDIVNADQAIAACTRALGQGSKSAGLLANLSNAYAAKKDFENSIKYANAAISLDPKFGPAYRYRGAVFVQQQKIDEALNDLNKAIELGVRHPNVYLNRAEALSAKKMYDDALLDCDEALKTEPSNVRAYNTRGVLLASKGEYEKAVAAYDQALRLKAGDELIIKNKNIAIVKLQEIKKQKEADVAAKLEEEARLRAAAARQKIIIDELKVGKKSGYGVIALGDDKGPICYLAGNEGRGLLNSVGIGTTVDLRAKFVETINLGTEIEILKSVREQKKYSLIEDLFKDLHQRQCGSVFGSESNLKSVIIWLENEKTYFFIVDVWFSQDELAKRPSAVLLAEQQRQKALAEERLLDSFFGIWASSFENCTTRFSGYRKNGEFVQYVYDENSVKYNVEPLFASVKTKNAFKVRKDIIFEVDETSDKPSLTASKIMADGRKIRLDIFKKDGTRYNFLKDSLPDVDAVTTVVGGAKPEVKCGEESEDAIKNVASVQEKFEAEKRSRMEWASHFVASNQFGKMWFDLVMVSFINDKCNFLNLAEKNNLPFVLGGTRENIEVRIGKNSVDSITELSAFQRDSIICDNPQTLALFSRVMKMVRQMP